MNFENLDLSIQYEMNYSLIRRRDKLKNESIDICFIEFEKSGAFKKKHRKPKVGRCLLMSPFNSSFTWQTTLITKILESAPGYLRFTTENSEYELFFIGRNAKASRI